MAVRRGRGRALIQNSIVIRRLRSRTPWLRRFINRGGYPAGVVKRYSGLENQLTFINVPPRGPKLSARDMQMIAIEKSAKQEKNDVFK